MDLSNFEWFSTILVLSMVGIVFFMMFRGGKEKIDGELVNKTRNAWDICFFNSTLALVMLFIFWLFTSESEREVRITIAAAVGLVATAEKIIAYFKKGG